MKTLLAILFYNAIIAVNMAIMVSGLLRLAAIKREKEKKPNPEFTPPPKKEPEVELRSALIKIVNAEKIAQRWYSPDEQIPRYAILLGEPYKFLSEMDKDGGKLVEFVRIKPPSAGTNATTPKEHKYDKFSCLYSPFCNLTREQVLDGLDRYIKDFRPNDLLDRVENEIRKKIKDDQRTGTQPIQSFFGEIRGGIGNEVLGTVAAKSEEELKEKLKALSDRLDRVEKKPVTPERLKEAGFETEPVRSCGSCYWFSEGGGGKFGLCIRNDEIADKDGQKACFDPKERRSRVRPKPLGTVTTH